MKNINIALVGLGQIGIYLYNELQVKKKDIEIKTGKKTFIDFETKSITKTAKSNV